ncbi:hypothetical protein VKT23_004753 [Stygiomarasmius scandens]|uniref:Uncharacterized protein n=1 Tax=Marasmiellus scandens TaxID=2682957 RepID=A0ABR1JV37_9AGAR
MAGHGITGFPCSSQQDLSVGDIVGVRISPVQVYCEAIGHKADAAQRDARSRRTRQSQHEASARGPRPAVIMDQRTDPSSGQKSFQVCVCASFSSTRWESLHNNTKDLIIPITNSKITFPDGVRLLRTDPPWPKDIQYVITRSVWTSDIEEWRCRGGQRYRVGQEDCDLLDVIGMEQEHSLAEKLRTYPRNGAGWLEDIKRAIAVVNPILYHAAHLEAELSSVGLRKRI